MNDSIGDIKKHWEVIRTVCRKTNNKEETTTGFYYNDSLIEDPQANANNINNYYANIGAETNASVGKSTNESKYYLANHSEKNKQDLLLTDITQQDVIDVCKKLKPQTSTDHEGFRQDVILSDINILAPVIAHLVNCSQKTGIFPENGKIARVIPVYKGKGSKHQFENYRPISLLSTFSKIVERLIYNKVFDFLVRYEILFESQYGFRTGHNTTHATLDFIKTIESTIEQNSYAIGVFCDLSKAFDTLNHNILLEKLDHYGIRGTTNSWFKSYLTNRQQFVELNGCRSPCLPLTTGVPQGSILGPLLFLLYINDLPSAANLKCVMFADDCNLLIKGNNIKDLIATLNCELESISDYFKANQLKLNAKKTKMVFFRKKSIPTSLEQLPVTLDGEILSFDNDVKFLGLNIDGTLSWDKHCTEVANTISRNNAVINRVKHLLPPPSLKILYHSFIQPHIHYGLPAWGGCNTQNKKRIVNIQKRAIRTVTKSYYIAHTEPRMKKFGLLKLDFLYQQQCLLLTLDCYYGSAPQKVKEQIILDVAPNYSLRNQSQNPLDLKLSTFKTRAGSNSFSAQGPSFWNDTPHNLREINQKFKFKFAVKKTLLEKYEHLTNCSNPRCKDRQYHN